MGSSQGVRFEYQSDGVLVCSDHRKTHDFSKLCRVVLGEYAYVNLSSPYQGLYIMDRGTCAQLLNSAAASLDFSRLPIRESANKGLVWTDIPQGCYSGSFVGYEIGNQVDPGALVHHIPNNYAQPDYPWATYEKNDTRWAVLPVAKLVSEKGSNFAFGKTLLDSAFG